MRQWGRPILVLACLAVVLTATGLVADAQQYETPQTLKAADVVVKGAVTGPHYKIRPDVAYDGYMYRFTVDSDYGVFEVTGDGALRNLLNEIRAITALRETKNLKAYGEGLKKSTKAPLAFVKNLATQPVDTLSGVPKGTYQIMENVGENVTNTRNPAQDSRAQEAIKFSAWKRDTASKLGVDPYSRNKVLQKELNAVAWAATIGDWTTSLVLLPVGGPGVSVVSGLSLAESAKNALKEEPPARLRIINDDKLKAVGIPEDLRKKFLDQPHYTPTQSTIMAAALSGLGTAKGREALLQVALSAEDEVMSTFFVNVAQILRGYHDGSPITELRVVGQRLVVAEAANGAMIPLPVDRLIWTDRVDQVSQSLKAGLPGKAQLWLTGTISPAARTQLQGRGFEIVERARERMSILDF
jgi:hypothetical protein